MIRYVRSFPIEGLALISTSCLSPPETHEFHLESVVLKSDHQAGDGVEDIRLCLRLPPLNLLCSTTPTSGLAA